MAREQLRLLLALGVLTISAFGSYCGKTAVPYSFEVLPNGAPVLGCAQPSCVAAAEEPLTEDSEFLTDVAGQSDGFFRDGDRALKRYRHDSAPKLIANCSGQFNELSCPRKNQFVGGIEFIDHPRQPLILQCCTYDGLRFSQEVGTTTVGVGEAITGGEVIRNGRQISFDVIANVRKIVRSTGSQRVQYEVTVRRMNCLPDPVEPEVDVDEDVPSEVLRVLSNASAKEVGATEKPEKKGGRKGGRKNPKQNAAPTEEISDDTNNQPSGLGRNNEQPAPPPSQQPVYQQPQQPLIPPQPVQQAPQQQLIDPNQQQFVPAAPVETSTAFPTLPTLIPTHTFPTHTFPTLPSHTHTFPTFAPHTFPAAFTFPPFTVTPAPAPAPFPAFGAPASSSGVAFAAPSVSVGSPVNPPAVTAIPTLPTFAPFSAAAFPGFSPLPLFGASTAAPPLFGQQQDANVQQVQQPAALPQQPQQPFVAQQQQPVGPPVQQPATVDGATQQQFQPVAQAAAQPQQFQQPAAPPSSAMAMGTILQNFQGAFRPIELPGMGVVGYGSATKK